MNIFKVSTSRAFHSNAHQPLTDSTSHIVNKCERVQWGRRGTEPGALRSMLNKFENIGGGGARGGPCIARGRGRPWVPREHILNRPR